MASYLLLAFMTAVVGGSECTILQFTADWCQPCQQMHPALQRLANEGWDVRTVDTDQQPQLVQQFNVQNLPTLVFLSGDQEVDRIVGATPYEQIHKRASRVAARNGNGPPEPAPERPTPTSPQPIVRGQSPGIQAFAASANNMLAAAQSMAVAGSLHAQPTSGPPSSNSRDTGSFAATSETPTLTVAQAVARAGAATVRIRVDEGNTTAYGTGTIVDVHGSDALVLTCGHLFREMKPDSVLSIDLFAGSPQEINLTAQLIDFKADETDIGLISFVLPTHIEPVQLLPRGEQLTVGQPAFSFGCDQGANPTRRDTRVTNINRYIGAENIEIAGAPAVGRSGGGLFDLQGRLIGVCNAADANDDEGIYAGGEVIYEQIQRLGLSQLFEIPERTESVQMASTRQASPGLTALARSSSAEQTPPTATTQPPWPDESPVIGNSLSAPLESGRSHTNNSGNQLLCIIRDASGREKLITIDAPSNDLLQRIDRDAQEQRASSR